MENPDVLGLPLGEAEKLLDMMGFSISQKNVTMALTSAGTRTGPISRSLAEVSGMEAGTEARVVRVKWINPMEVELVYVTAHT